ncbi:hypothetical protein [Moheibacter sediminis]|uniref:Uncharacterized protein n=1 Tax=Moheibacter sediminis TaxID=1434700 RepID=A0A1W1ZAR8_9FLAO|nr:hypothetical protein [Moheibacter sediminis]SMC45509.1 hypothetical protein SAMN06296427_102334 [Moheibacter sediminis]
MEKFINYFKLCHSDKGRIHSETSFLVLISNILPRNDNRYQFKMHINFLLIVISGLIFSCQKSSIPIKPEILTATYEIRAHSEFERGFELFLVIDKIPENPIIKRIVFQNKLFENVHFTKMTENEIFIEQYFPIQSKMIQDFSPPKTDTRSDGIVFEVDGKEYFYKVTFKLK